MKFAVVEYSSKSGGIWRHRDDKPNYLEDPQKIIDPTSFGCYVSALKGEHIPITWLANTSLGLNSIRKAHKRLLGSWPSYSLDYLKQFDTIMVVHQISDAHEVLHFAQRVKKKLPHIFILGVPTQPFGILQPTLDSHPEQKKIFVDFVNTCDVFLTVVKSTQTWYESLAQTPVVYLPQIYPTHFASQFFLPREQKKKIIFAAGITDRPNISQGFAVSRQLQQEFPEYVVHVTQIPDVKMDFSELQGARYEIQPFREWKEQLPYLATVEVIINPDCTATRGRVQVDAAAVGTPSVGGNSDGTTDLYPELTSSPETSTEELVTKGRRLLTDNAYYEKITQYAADHLKKYDYEESAVRLQLLVKQYRS
ncbi:MAG: glycosyltransferase [Patescibacteria group bacterium]|mgnify:CR=1 FL=1